MWYDGVACGRSRVQAAFVLVLNRRRREMGLPGREVRSKQMEGLGFMTCRHVWEVLTETLDESEEMTQ